jgi:transposase-like protein
LYNRRITVPKKNPPTGTDADLNMATMAPLFNDEEKARLFIEGKRWPNGPVCPHCECKEVYTLTPKPGSKSPVRPGVYKCKKCRKQFTARVGTIFEDSKIPFSKWLMAIHLMTSSKKGVSSHQIKRELGVTIKTAWFITHRVREAMKLEPFPTMLSGVVECDETYVGGKPRIPGESKRGRGTAKKPVMVLVQRDGESRCMPLERVDGAHLKSEIAVTISPDADVMTDDLSAYQGLGNTYHSHQTINHSRKKYARNGRHGLRVHTNTAESFFALIKRGHYGIFHQLSKKHLARYCTEFEFRWNHRKVSDGQRMVSAIKSAEGKRLFYRDPVAGLTASEVAG